MDFLLSFRDYKLCNLAAQLVESMGRIFRRSSAVARVGKNRLQVQPLALNFSLLPCSPGQNSFLRLRLLDIGVLKCNADLILQKRFFIPGYEYVRLELWLVSSYTEIDG